MMNHRSASMYSAALAVGVSVIFSGCTQRLNEGDGLYGAALPALDPSPASFLSDAPSVTAGHDRSHWAGQSVKVPLRQIEHHPSYVHEFLLEPTTHRATGAFPTTSSALEVDEPTVQRAAESPINVIGAGALIIWAPIDMLFNGRWPLTVERGARLSKQVSTNHHTG